MKEGAQGGGGGLGRSGGLVSMACLAIWQMREVSLVALFTHARVSASPTVKGMPKGGATI